MRQLPLVLAILVGCKAPGPTGSVIEAGSPAIKGGVMTQSMGIETMGQRLTPFLTAGCQVPCVNSSTFSTSEDNQTEITLRVLRGDSGQAGSHHSLGRFAISGFPARARGVPQVLVIFGAVGEDLTLDARDAATGVKYKVVRVGS